MRVSSESTLDLPCDGPPKMEPLPAPRATRFLLLQNSELTCSDLAMLIAQTLDNGQYAHTVRDRLHFRQFQSPPAALPPVLSPKKLVVPPALVVMVALPALLPW